jgi:hypothetical protein
LRNLNVALTHGAFLERAFSSVIFAHSNAITITGETAVFDDIGASGLRV